MEGKHRFSRTEMLIGRAGLEKLAAAKVIIFGVGGVGSYAVEALARSGVGQMTLVDFDTVDITNLNRQLHALDTTVGRYKVDLMAERIKLINPSTKVTALRQFYSPEAGEELFSEPYTYVVDAIDNITGKLDIIKRCYSNKITVISSMGAGNKLDPAAFKVGDISETSVDPLARVIRRELKKFGITRGVKVVFSTEQPRVPQERIAKASPTLPSPANEQRRPLAPGSISFVPAAAGLVLAGAVVRDIIEEKDICHN